MTYILAVGAVAVNTIALCSDGTEAVNAIVRADEHSVAEPAAARVGAVIRFYKPRHIQREPVVKRKKHFRRVPVDIVYYLYLDTVFQAFPHERLPFRDKSRLLHPFHALVGVEEQLRARFFCCIPEKTDDCAL